MMEMGELGAKTDYRLEGESLWSCQYQIGFLIEVNNLINSGGKHWKGGKSEKTSIEKFGQLQDCEQFS